MTLPFILAQIFGFAYLIPICLSYASKVKGRFLLLQLAGNICIVLSYVFLGAMVALIGTAISCLRCIVFYIYERKHKTPPLWLVLIMVGLIILNGVLFWGGFFDLLIMAALILFMLAFTIKNVITLKVVILVALALILVFNISAGAYSLVLSNVFEMFIAAFTVVYGRLGGGLQKHYGNTMLKFAAPKANETQSHHWQSALKKKH